MNFTLHTVKKDETGVYGILDDEKGVEFCFTLEHNFDTGPVIPAGTWKCTRRLSPHFGYDVFMLTGIPGHDFVEIHKGNTQADSKGCILLGRMFDDHGITQSKSAFDKFMKAQEGVSEFSLTVIR